MSRKRKIRTGLGLLILAFSTLFLVWGYWPAHRELRARPVSGAVESTPAGQRAITLLFPPKIRVGEAGVVRLTLDADALREFLPPSGKTGSSNAYDTHKIIAEARFDLPGIPVRPSELISAPVSQGQTAVFYWTLRPTVPGNFRGTIWLYLRLVDKLTGEESRETVSAQIVEIESVKFLGLAVNSVRTVGLVGGGTGLFLSLPLFGALTARLYRKRSGIL
jgi:hypothetical protein